jgi:hypothetical protein
MLDLRNIVIYITIFGMEISWLYAALNAINKAVADRLSIPLLMVTLLISFGISRGLRFLPWPKAAQTFLSWIIWSIGMLLMVKVQLFPETAIGDPVWLASIPLGLTQIFSYLEPALLVLAGTAVLWWLGRRLAYARADFATTISESQFGLIILVIVFFVAYEEGLDQSSSLPIALAFFSLALFGAAVSHSQNSSWLGSWKKGQWPVILLVSIGVILVSGLLISIIVTPDLIQLFLRALRWIWDVIEHIMAWIASLFPPPSPSSVPSMPSLPAPGPDENQGFNLPEWLRPGLSLVWEIVVAGFVVVAIWRISSQILSWMRRQAIGLGGEVESLRGAFKKDLLDFIKNFLSKVFRIKFKSRDNGLRNIPPEIASVRQLYKELLKWAARAGFPRQIYQTPEEFRFNIERVAGENQDDLSFITRCYMDTRYGAVSPSESEFNQLKQKWSQLKKSNLNKKSEPKG